MALWAPQPFMGSGWGGCGVLVSPTQQVLTAFSIASQDWHLTTKACVFTLMVAWQKCYNSVYIVRKMTNKLNSAWHLHTPGLWDIRVYLPFHVSLLLFEQVLAKGFAVVTAATGLVWSSPHLEHAGHFFFPLSILKGRGKCHFGEFWLICLLAFNTLPCLDHRSVSN